MPELRVRRNDIAVCELAEGEPVREDLADEEAQLLVERFALTTNNVTYAALGDQLGYWRLFPAPDGWGRVPAWGYATVIASRSPALAEGRRVFGLVPMAARLTVRPAAHPLGFVDAAPHRAGLSPVYNQYLAVEGEGDDVALVMRPLFGTSVLLDLALSDAGFDGAGTVVLTSASSRTAYGLAHLLRGRPVQTVGLTSASRREWVEALGLYDAALAYDDLDRLAAPGGAVLVDFAGDRALLRRVHEQLGDALVRSVVVGFTHRRLKSDEAPLPGPAPAFFFAPDEMERRGRALGPRYAEAWESFAPVVRRMLRVERITGGEQLVRVYRDLVAGRADPAVAHVASLD
jgi:Protein of unknown function (DUF2855)